MNNEYLFGCADGWLGRQAAKIAKKHGATLVNYSDPGCRCGHGCAGTCPATMRHWFAAQNRGEPFDSTLAQKVLAEIAK